MPPERIMHLSPLHLQYISNGSVTTSNFWTFSLQHYSLQLCEVKNKPDDRTTTCFIQLTGARSLKNYLIFLDSCYFFPNNFNQTWKGLDIFFTSKQNKKILPKYLHFHTCRIFCTKKKFDKIKKIWYESENAEMKTKIKCDKWYKDCIGEVSYSQPNFSSDTCLFNICTSHKKM